MLEEKRERGAYRMLEEKRERGVVVLDPRS
jgi:hypothetical protein